MRSDPATLQRAVAVLTAASLVLSPAAPLLAAPNPAQSAAQPAQPAGPPKPKATPAPPPPAATKPGTVAPPADGGWPRAYAMPSGGKVLVYQPQVASWDGQRQMVAYAAVSYESKGAPKPALGSIKVEADTKVAVSDRLVNFSSFKITESNFPTLPKEHMQEAVAEIAKAIPDEDRVIGLDRVLAMVDRSQIIPKEVPGVKADPPTIFWSALPAVLVNIDGDAIWSPIKENDLKFAVNTNWDLFEHGPTKTFYLLHDGSWLQAAEIKGPWTPAGALPDSFKKLPADDNWKEVKAALPGRKVDPKKTPKVFVSTTPAELVLLEGKAVYKPVPGTSLQWVSNTESDVFRQGTTGTIYYLVAGRWFQASGPDGSVSNTRAGA